MISSLILDNQKCYPGSKILILSNAVSSKNWNTWTGVIDSLNLFRWTSHIEPCVIFADGFVKNGKTFSIYSKKILGLYVTKKYILPDGDVWAYPGQIKILTRLALNEFESSQLGEWPNIIGSDTRLAFISEDIQTE